MDARIASIGLMALAVTVTAACGGKPSARSTPPPVATTSTIATTGPATTGPATTVDTAAPAGNPGTSIGLAPAPASPVTTGASPEPTATTVSVSPPVTQLGPEWLQRGGRVLIEAAASGDPEAALRDLRSLGLTEGVVFAGLVNGWLPVGALDAARRLATVQFIRPTGAGTGAAGG